MISSNGSLPNLWWSLWMYGRTRLEFQPMHILPWRKSKMWVHITIQSQGLFWCLLGRDRNEKNIPTRPVYDRSRRSGGNRRRAFITGYQRFHNDNTCHASKRTISFAAGSSITAEWYTKIPCWGIYRNDACESSNRVSSTRRSESPPESRWYRLDA